MTPSARVGIFGGTFNPIHVGHLRAAEEVIEALDLERMIFVPCAEPPHKAGSAGEPIALPEQRLAWVRAAVRDNLRFEVDPLEVERAGPSYTVDTLRLIGARLAPERPVFALGQDAFAEVGTWRDPQTLFTLAHFAVFTRPPVATGSLADWLPKCVCNDIAISADGRSGRHPSAGTWLRLLEIPGLDVSASEIRRRLREGLSVRYLVPEAVIEAVERSGVYAAEAGK